MGDCKHHKNTHYVSDYHPNGGTHIFVILIEYKGPLTCSLININTSGNLF